MLAADIRSPLKRYACSLLFRHAADSQRELQRHRYVIYAFFRHIRCYAALRCSMLLLRY